MVGATFSPLNHPKNFRPLQPPFHPHSVVDPSAFQIFVCMFIFLSVRSFVYLFIHLFVIHSLVPSLAHSLVFRKLIHSLVPSFICSSFIHSIAFRSEVVSLRSFIDNVLLHRISLLLLGQEVQRLRFIGTRGGKYCTFCLWLYK